VCHAFLAPQAAKAGHIAILFFRAAVAVECFTPTPIIPLIKQLHFALVWRESRSDVSDIAMRNEDDDLAFRHDWQKFSGTDDEKFDDCVSVDSHLVTTGVNRVEELCESHVAALSLEGEDSKPKPGVVSNFAEAHAALMKVKSFVSAHSK
jgi:hypothetical protein